MADWERQLAAQGCRVTASRRAIMCVLERASAPLDPQEILERARAQHPQLGLVTVYRTMALLGRLGLVRRVHQPDSCHGYLLASPGHHHALVCHRCGQAIEFAGGRELDTLVQRVERETGFCVEEHLLQLYGICEQCLRKD